jgi:hypothetical protein
MLAFDDVSSPMSSISKVSPLELFKTLCKVSRKGKLPTQHWLDTLYTPLLSSRCNRQNEFSHEKLVVKLEALLYGTEKRGLVLEKLEKLKKCLPFDTLLGMVWVLVEAAEPVSTNDHEMSYETE